MQGDGALQRPCMELKPRRNVFLLVSETRDPALDGIIEF